MATRIEFSLRRTLVLLALTLTFQAAFGATIEVTVGDNFFSPDDVTIAPGDTVRWVNAAGGAGHDLDSDQGLWATLPISSSWTFEFTFNNEGVFTYHCNPHAAFGMDGTVRVETAMAAAELELVSVAAADGDYAPGEMLTIDSSIRNNGDAASGSFTITYYASGDSNITSGDTELGSANVGGIGAGATSNIQDMVVVPESAPAGEYFIGAIITFSDADANNNSNHDGTSVTFWGLFIINAGLNDAWVSADAAFQGFFFTVFQDIGFFFLSWFTFDSVLPIPPDTAVFGAFDQRWVTASGLYEGNSVSLAVELTTGGIFNASDPLATQDPTYGTMTIVFRNCNEAVLTYNFPSLGLSGQMVLTRVVADNVPMCEMLNEELLAQ